MTTCVRAAWLTLGASSIQLENQAAGYFLESLDLGYSIRPVSDMRPNQDGAVDRTQYLGPRTVTAAVHALVGAGAQIDAVAAAFAPYMVPSARPQLHYVLDRPGAAERVLTLRPHNYDWPIAGAYERAIALQWVAPDPVAYGPIQRVATAWSGASAGAGRGYNWQPPRQYPAGTGSAVAATVISPGDLPFQPYLRIYGPITAAQVLFQPSVGAMFFLPLLTTARIDAGHFLGIDTALHTAYLDDNPAQPWLNQIDWSRWQWPNLPVSPANTVMSLSGNNTTGASQVQATWADKYLT